MKIAIIGGGFYGCYLAYKLIKDKNKVTIFEKNKKILSEAAINNQYRLHKGFHYPRSTQTIKQTKQGANLFIKEFKKFVYFPKLNIYAVHKNSNINFKKYLKKFRDNKISFKVLNNKIIKKFFINPKEIDGAINVREGVIKLNELYKDLKKKIKKAKLVTNTEINKINVKKRRIYYKNKYQEFDLIINCTFINPNLGLEKNYFKIKYEMASMLHVKNFFNKNTAITLMDGLYGSLYPINENILTLSSVKYTPFRKFKKLKEYKKFAYDKNFKKIINKNSLKIINHLKKFFIIPKKIKIIKITTAPKVKVIKDYNDQRLSIIKSNKRIISILCGKLDAAPLVWNDLKKII